MATCDCAIEFIFTMGLLAFVGYESKKLPWIGTDNKGAHDLCHRFTSAQNSRHVDRKLFKLREMRGREMVAVRHVPTEKNTADILTKLLSNALFERHSRAMLNEPAGEAIESMLEKRAK